MIEITKVEVNEKYEVLLKKDVYSKMLKLKEESKGKEVGGFFVAEKANPFYIIDTIIPIQEVTGSSIEFKDINNKSCYQHYFIETFKTTKTLVGTWHYHPISGFSGTDDDDMLNSAPNNFLENLPFIDIIITPQNEFNSRMIMKIFKSVMYLPVDLRIASTEKDKKEYDAILENIEKLLDKTNYEIRTLKLDKKIDVSEDLKKVSEKVYNYSGNGRCGCNNYSGFKQETIDDKLNKLQVNTEYDKNHKVMTIIVKGDDAEYSFYDYLMNCGYLDEVKHSSINCEVGGEIYYEIEIDLDNIQEYYEMKTTIKTAYFEFSYCPQEEQEEIKKGMEILTNINNKTAKGPKDFDDWELRYHMSG